MNSGIENYDDTPLLDPRDLAREHQEIRQKLIAVQNGKLELSEFDHLQLLRRLTSIMYELNPSTAKPSARKSTARTRVAKTAPPGPEISLEDL